MSFLRAAVAAAALLLIPVLARAQVRPTASWRQIESQHFRIVYEQGLDSLAVRAAQRAELEYARLSAGLIGPPRGKIDIIVSDNMDITNGSASFFPSNRIRIWVRPPVEELSLQYYNDWVELVVTHELTHIFHMDRSGKVGRALRFVFGRMPLGWPVFPVAEVPDWNIEGLATLVESQHTGAGRVYGSYHEMIVRTAILEKAFDPIDRVSNGTPIWPGAQRAYIYGSLFMDYIARRHGPTAHNALIKATAGSVLPPSWRMDAVAKKAVGKSFRDLYADWQREMERDYAVLADTLRTVGITKSERITTDGRWAVHARISPDNKKLAYADENGRSSLATRTVDLATGKAERVRRNGIGPLAWLPDNSGYITAQFQLINPYEIYSDLYLMRDGRETRLTHVQRAESPDVSSDGARVVYVQNARGTNRLVVRELSSGAERVVVERSPDVQWTLPRWSPDGSRIVAQRWTRAHGHDVVIIADNGKVLQEIDTEGTDAAPAWSPDGRYIVFSSDRTGITNLYAHQVGRGELRQVTNVLGGAFYPDISNDGKFIYYSSYHADGYYIERIPYDVDRWRTPLAASSAVALRIDTVARFDQPATETMTVTAPHRYSALRSLMPAFWLPLIYTEDALGTFYGLTTAGVDDVDRHSYYLGAAYAPEQRRLAGNFNYTWLGLGNPALSLDAAREWDSNIVRVTRENGLVDTLDSYEREDRVALTTSFSRPRWRSGSVLILGVEAAVFNRGVLGPARFTDPQDKMYGVIAGFGFGNARRPAYAISLEDGMRASAFVRRRFEADPQPNSDASYTEVFGSGSAYKSISAGSFAHHVLGVRGSAVSISDVAPGPTDVGGADDFLPVRGYRENARIGFKAWSASAEYRIPLAMIGRGWRVRPLFIDRVSGSLFVDAGNTSCNAEQAAIYRGCPGSPGRSREMLLSVGAELNANVAVLSFYPGWIRGGVAFPKREDPKFYLTFGQAF